MTGRSLLKLQQSKAILCLVASGLLCFLFSLSSVGTAQEKRRPLVAIYGSEQSSVAEVIAGGMGTAYLVYYRPENGPEQPAVIVRLSKVSVDSVATAEVFDTPPGDDHITLEFVNGFPVVPDGVHPVVTLTAPDGWWVRDGLVNYNLDITVYGPIMSMWKSGGETGWSGLLERVDENARIIVRDPDGDGLPDWDWRTMTPEFWYRGDYRTTYAEQKCSTPLSVQRGISPEWPFFAEDLGYGFEQDTGILRPPIVVDWDVGRVSIFSEIVTLRNQNCSYGMYSIARVLPGRQNRPNFETPFAFYDISSEGKGYPNLLLRTQRAVDDDETLFIGENPETQSIRYSWRNQVGDWNWDYKVDVLGQHHYDYETPIAGGAAFIDAPPYEAFPTWVVDRDWPATSFVATEGVSYRSSEGIYEWSMLNLARDYFFGWQKEPYLSPFEDIRAGLRGEYRIASVRPPETYFSPIDNRLHLKWAEHGIWRLDEEQIVRVGNLDNDETIDTWSREVLPVPSAHDADGGALNESIKVVLPEIIEELYALNGYLIHYENSIVTLTNADYNPVLFESLPPTNHETWEAHRAQLAPYENERRDPADLLAWLDANSSSKRAEIAGASVTNMRKNADGFSFALTLEPGYRATGLDLFDLAGLASGKYLVENNGHAFVVTNLGPAQVSLDTQLLGEVWATDAIKVNVHNYGMTGALGLTLVMAIADWDDAIKETGRTALDVVEGETVGMLLELPSNLGEACELQFWIEDSRGEQLTVPIVVPIEGSDIDEHSNVSIGIVSIHQTIAFSFLILSLFFLMGTGLKFVLAGDD